MTKIPKIIHYCWFGDKEIPETLAYYIEQWKLILPDYQFIKWDESTFDVNENSFVKEAYCSKKWAFVSDYARLKALINMGGIYLDTDVELFKSFDSFLNCDAFVGFESNNNIGTAIIGSTPNNPFIKKLMQVYHDKHFMNQDGSLDMTPNPHYFNQVIKDSYNGTINNTFQKLGDVTLFPSEYFYPKTYGATEAIITENTICDHKFDGSWVEPQDKYKDNWKDKTFLLTRKILGGECASLLLNRYNKVKSLFTSKQK